MIAVFPALYIVDTNRGYPPIEVTRDIHASRCNPGPSRGVLFVEEVIGNGQRGGVPH